MDSKLTSLLKAVSRSFYLSLGGLPPGLRPTMGVAYLLCRAADTVADTSLLPPERRLELISAIRGLFSAFPLPTDKARQLSTALQSELSTEPSSERLLITRLGDCLDALAGLSMTDQALVQRIVVHVATGMEMDLRHFGVNAETVTSFETERQLNDYIGWIGGEPGRFWTDVCVAHGVRFGKDVTEMQRLGHRFGTGLQMVNILRDLPSDLKIGRCYLPVERLRKHGLTVDDVTSGKTDDRFRTLYNEMIGETVERLEAGLIYAQQLPRTAISLRGAVWWPLALGLKTLGLLRNARFVLEGTAPIKVSRKEVYWLLCTSLPELPFNGLLRSDFEDLAEPARVSAGL